ncbi:NIF-domain-containing protein [Testicularia cyperi]|uniref:NIF-domain-containing protein n=1 Tax=Testicularia cyperi TaxID=1882483 RepID=A0A317XGN8_9BASI|nr:NIF-domain-containing protein [Testicularia cyperi]
MNSLSYLDSVLSRSFAGAEQRAPTPSSSASSASSSSGQRSRSHSSLPGTRRGSSTSPSTPSGSSSYRRWSQDEDRLAPDSRVGERHRLRRTGSTPAGVYAANAIDTDDSEEDGSQPRRARWSGLWGLTGWIDEAIHPESRSRSRKNSLSETHAARRAKRVPSLNDLPLASTGPQRDIARRTASSGTTSYYRRSRSGSSSSEEGRSTDSRRSKRRSRFGQSASLTLTVGDSIEDRHSQYLAGQHDHLQPRIDDPELMSEKEREDIVEFVGGDFAPEEIDAPRERTISQGSSTGSSWADGSSVSHDQVSLESVPTEEVPGGSSTEVAQHASSDEAHQDEVDEKDVDAETLLEAAKGDTEAMEAVAQEDPGSTLAEPVATTAAETPRKAVRADDKATDNIDEDEATPKQSAPPPYVPSIDRDMLSPPTPTLLRRSSSRRNRSRQLDGESAPSTSNSSPVSTDSERTVERSLSLSKPRRKRSSRSSSAAVSEAEQRDDLRDWTVTRGSPLTPGVGSGSSAPPTRCRKFSTTRTIRKTLAALRDLILTILLCPLRCVQMVRKRQAIRVQDAVDAMYERADRAQIPILEKAASLETPTPRSRVRPPSLRFDARPNEQQLKSHEQRDDEKRTSAINGRPRTPKPEAKAFFDDDEPVTEDQAAEKGEVWKALEPTGPRTPSRLLPNPHRIDPMLAHDSKAKPIDEAMAEKEAMMEAERQSRIAKGRAARRAAAAGSAPGSGTDSKGAALMAASQVHRGPATSIIHHSPKILVLDLDETLIHSTSRSPSQFMGLGVGGPGRTTTSGFLGLETVGATLGLRANENPRRIRPHMVEVVLDGRSVLYHVYKRPWADYFLRKVASWYTVVVFTASVQEYADPVIDWLDQGRGLISARLFRESCSYKNGSYVKNLQVVDQDLAKVCLVDNSPASYAINRANGIPIEGWTHDPNDEALLDLLPILDSLRFATDVRHILGIRGFAASP